MNEMPSSHVMCRPNFLAAAAEKCVHAPENLHGVTVTIYVGDAVRDSEVVRVCNKLWCWFSCFRDILLVFYRCSGGCRDP